MGGTWFKDSYPEYNPIVADLDTQACTRTRRKEFSPFRLSAPQAFSPSFALTKQTRQQVLLSTWATRQRSCGTKLGTIELSSERQLAASAVVTGNARTGWLADRPVLVLP